MVAIIKMANELVQLGVKITCMMPDRDQYCSMLRGSIIEYSKYNHV